MRENEGERARLHREHQERRARLWPIEKPSPRPKQITPPPLPKVPAPEKPPENPFGAGIAVPAKFARPLSPHNSVTVQISPDLRKSLLRVALTPVIISVVAQHFDVSVNEILSQRRHVRIVTPRHIAIYLTKKMTPRSLPEIGRSFGNRDHTSILNAVRKITFRMSTDYEFAETVERLRARILGVE